MLSLLLLMVGPASLFAGVGGAGVMPWEGPLGIIATSLTGPAAAAIGLIGLVVAGGTMVFHHDLGQFGQKMAFIALAMSVMLLATRFVTGAFGVAAAIA